MNGLPGVPGMPGLKGMPGQPGGSGNPGLPGRRGEPGTPGLPGFGTRKGEQGDAGLPGADGYPGIPGPKGESVFIQPLISDGAKGERGDRGYPGAPGLPGTSSYPGSKGYPGQVGLPGRAGNPGSLGGRGPVGDFGAAGLPGSHGAPGAPGAHGRPGPAGDAGDGSFIFVRHSQDTTTPQCPQQTTKLQDDGYSFMGMQGDTYAAHQDLGNSGSCLRRFSAMPFLFCDIGNACHYASRNDYSYWLSTNEPMSSSMSPFEAREIPKHLSRCVVCESPTPVFAVHSQSQRVPTCPDGYDQLWTGYSFVFTSADGGRGDQQSLQSPGSCLEKYHDRPYFHCKDHSHCNYYPNMMTFYLATLDDTTGFEKTKLRTLKAGTQRQYVSRCAVCHANLFKQTAGGTSAFFAQVKKL
jgi:collagen type IV alpha